MLKSIMSDRDHDKIMIEGCKEEIRKLELKIKYYEGRIDAINDALGEFQEYKNNIDKEKE